MKARLARDYNALESLVASDQALHVSAFVERVDRFIDANRRLRDVTRERVAVGIAERVDQTYIVAALGLFGPDVEVLDERITGDDAIVTYTAAGRLPPESVTLRRASAGWQIDPGPGFSPLMSEAFAAMADGLTRLAARIDSGELAAADLLKNPEQLPREVESAMRRGLELLSSARAKATGSRP